MIYSHLLKTISEKGAAFLVLIDPDRLCPDKLSDFIRTCNSSGVDGFLIGGSLLLESDFEEYIKLVKLNTKLPVIIFPGGISQINKSADAIFFLSVISGRNPEHLIGKHVLSAPLIKKANLEPISIGYMLIESGSPTTVQYMSGSLPIPRNKPEIAAATALAAEYLGIKMIYLEAGSGAEYTVPDEMIKAVSRISSLPLIVGGGITTPIEARSKVDSGAGIIVIGNFFENENNHELIKDFADAVHTKKAVQAKPVH